MARPDKDDAIKRKRRRSPPKRRSTDPAARPPAAPDNEAIKVVPAVWVESPSLIALNTPARGSKAADVRDVFHAPAVIAAPTRRSAFAQIRAAVTQLSLLAATAARQATVGFVRFAHWCGLGIRTIMQRARRVRAATAAGSSFARAVTRPIFLATRVMGVIVCCLAFYAAIVLAPASPDRAIERPAPPTSADHAPAGVAGAAKTPSPARQKPVEAKPTAPAKAVNSAASSVKIVNAPHMKASCQEQTWPYITHRCLAAQNGKIDPTAKPETNAGNDATGAVVPARQERWQRR